MYENLILNAYYKIFPAQKDFFDNDQEIKLINFYKTTVLKNPIMADYKLWIDEVNKK